MYDRILFPTDGSEGATTVFEHVLDIAETHNATLHIINVADTTHDSVTRIGNTVVDILEREGEQIVGDAAERATDRPITVVTEVLQGGVPESISGYADEFEIDLIVMPTHGRTGIERFLLGSVTERVVRQAETHVLTVRPDETAIRYPYQRLLVPTDGSACANAATETGITLATVHEAALHFLSVVDITSLGVDVHSEVEVDVLEDHANEVIEEVSTRAEESNVASVTGAIEQSGSIDRAIRSYIADQEIDLVVMGTHGRTGIDRYLLGSVTEKLIRTASVPVLAVPDGP